MIMPRMDVSKLIQVLSWISVIIEYGAPRNLWGYAVEYICHKINCTQVLARNDKTAYELIHGLKPDVSKFVPFYVPGIAYVSADE